MKKIGCKQYEGDLYRKRIVADPREELKIFIDSKLTKYYVGKAVRNYAGKIEKYERVSDYFDNFNQVREYRLYMINNCENGRYDYYIIDFIQDDDEYI